MRFKVNDLKALEYVETKFHKTEVVIIFDML